MDDYFATISDMVCNPVDSLEYIERDKFNGIFNVVPPERYEIMPFAEDIDINPSSGIYCLNSKMCKIILLHIQEKMKMIFANTMFSGFFQADWVISTVKLNGHFETV